MADSIRQDIIDAIKTQLATIKTTAGYETNIGNHVFEWKCDNWEENQTPGVSIYDKEEEVGVVELSRHDLRLNVSIIACVTEGTTTSANCRKALADIVKMVGLNKRWGGLAYSTFWRGSTMNVLQDETTKGEVEVRLEIRYRLGQFDPYTNPGQ